MPQNAVIGAPSSQQQPWSFTRLKEQMIPRMGCQQVPWIDIVIFGHEIDMLRYRLRLHDSIFSATVVVESNMTHAGLHKPLYARESLTREERKRYRVKLLTVPLHDIKAGGRRDADGSGRINMAREQVQRKFVNKYVAKHFPKHRVYMSDVDELLDPASVCSLPHDSCVTPSLRFHMYGIHCVSYSETPWQMPMLVRTDSAAFLNTILDRWLPMRGYRFYWPARYRAACSVAHGLHGWHLSYFFNTSLIVKKHMTYNHNDDPMIQALLRMSTSERSALLEHRVSHCIDPVDRHQKVDPNKRKHNITFEESPIDGRLPPIPGWPEHPLAPQTRPPPDARLGSARALSEATSSHLRHTGHRAHLSLRSTVRVHA